MKQRVGRLTERSIGALVLTHGRALSTVMLSRAAGVLPDGWRSGGGAARDGGCD